MGISFFTPVGQIIAKILIVLCLLIIVIAYIKEYKLKAFLEYLDKEENKNNYKNLNTFFSYTKNLITSIGSIVIVLVLVFGIWKSFIDTTKDVRFKAQIGMDQSRKDKNMVNYLRKIDAGDIQINQLGNLSLTQLKVNYLEELDSKEIDELIKLRSVWDTIPRGELEVQQLFRMNFKNISVKVNFGKGTTDLIYPDSNGLIDTIFTISKGTNHVVVDCFDESHIYEPARLREIIRSNEILDIGLITLTRRSQNMTL